MDSSSQALKALDDSEQRIFERNHLRNLLPVAD